MKKIVEDEIIKLKQTIEARNDARQKALDDFLKN